MLSFDGCIRRFFGVLAVLCLLTGGRTMAAEWSLLPGHVPPVVKKLKALGRVEATNQLRLAIGMALRDSAGLDAFIAGLYDPGSTNYQHYLTVDELTARFGPTEADYEAVKAFARSNGLAVSHPYRNRLVLDVQGPAAAVEQAFHLTLNKYQHPTEARQFYAPDAEPTVAAGSPVRDIQGLSDYYRPHPKSRKMNALKTSKNREHGGSSPDGNGYYFGNDFRNAYAPGTALTGAGQAVGLLEFDGFYSSDIAAYASAAGNGRANIAIQTVLVDGFDGVPSDGNFEVSLDIEMAMAMAPGLTTIVSFETDQNGAQNDLLNSMLTYSNTIHQLSCSWGWNNGPSDTTDAIFKSMAAVGQSFFDASGDTDAFTPGPTSANGVDNAATQNAPSSSPYIMQVGGTTLSTHSGAAYRSEIVWNWGIDDPADYDGVGSSGGVSSFYAMPSWQTNIANMAARGGSSSFRNIPDVAMVADDVYVISDNGQTGGGGGTSFSAPLWAGFIALVNQQAITNGKPRVGFINPAIYAIAASSNYAACFHDITASSNTWLESPTLFSAMAGYDLCAGLGTPNGTNLINALAPPPLPILEVLTGTNGYAFGGLADGAFNPNSGTFLLTNISSTPLNWSLVNTSAWFKANYAAGTLAAYVTTNITVSLTSTVSNLVAGSYASMIAFSNVTSQVALKVPMTLTVVSPINFHPAVKSAGSFQLTWSTTTGAVYQLQYKTNLVQTNWINIGSAATANTNTLTLTDTNAVILSRQRFYRLMVTP